MPHEGIYITDPETGQTDFFTYDRLGELDEEIRAAVCKPIGGFCYPADMYTTMPLANTPFYIQNWLPKHGKMCLYAPPKVGKSTLAIQVARCVGVGEPILGLAVEQGRSLYLQCELAPEILQKRLLSTGHPYPNMFVGSSFAMKLDTMPGQAQVKRALDAVEPQVVIFDALYKMLNGDENEAHDMLVVTNFFDEIIEAYECSVIIIHHSGKDIKRGGRGSSVVDDWVDSSLQMKRVEAEGTALRVQITPKLLRHAELPPEPIEAEMVDFEFEVVGARATIEGRLLQMFEDGQIHKMPEMMEISGGTRGGVNKALEGMIARGRIHELAEENTQDEQTYLERITYLLLKTTTNCVYLRDCQ